jgi:hypothetical protein
MQPDKIPQPSPAVIQHRELVLDPQHLLLLVPSKGYGSEGTEPVNDGDCPYFQEQRWSTSCVCGSGGSCCGGFRGTLEGYTRCGYAPKWTTPGHRYAVCRDEPTTPAQRRAGWN